MLWTALTQLIPGLYKAIPDATKAQEMAGAVHLAAINQINEIVYSALALVVGASLMYQLYQVDNGQVLNWLTFGVRFTIFTALLGERAKNMLDNWKVAQQMKKDSIGD